MFTAFSQKFSHFHSPGFALPGSKPRFALEELEGGQGEMLWSDLTPAEVNATFLPIILFI